VGELFYLRHGGKAISHMSDRELASVLIDIAEEKDRSAREEALRNYLDHIVRCEQDNRYGASRPGQADII
jgi:hypothetical protein